MSPKRMLKQDAITIIEEPTEAAERLPPDVDPTEPKVGRWYWVRPNMRVEEGVDDDGDPTYKTDDNGHWVYVMDPDDAHRRLECVTKIGSNYVELTDIRNDSHRIHINKFWDYCEFEPNSDVYIKGQVERYQKKTADLMKKVHELTSRLSLSTSPALGAGTDVAALTIHSSRPMDEYKTALIRAEKEDLPTLFKEISTSNEKLAAWMQASLIPLKAEAEALKPALDVVKQRIFSVELYAGLVETVVQVRDGDPAALTDKIHLMQRRAYMDEECLANYEAGGMEFKDIEAFDAWLGRPDNFYRVLPFPRCIVAMRVRRISKDRSVRGLSIGAFIQLMEEMEADKFTFLYIRNGDQLFRLTTGIEFDAKLFPDMDHGLFSGTGKIWVRMLGDRVEEMISDAAYQEKVETERREDEAYEKLPEDERWYHRRYSSFDTSDRYEAFTPENVMYDDIAAHIKSETDKHNRLVLVLQGLLDRSPVLHPHPPWSLWSTAGFEQALTLVYDDSRTLTTGTKPDFEAYRAKLNALIKPGSVTIGQELAWMRAEAVKENERLQRVGRGTSFYERETYRPYGNPGPGKLARVASVSKRSDKCTYEWLRPRKNDAWKTDEGEIRCTFSASMDELLNVDAYKPGDFKQFFNDPRTRADYLEWAPYLLEAEEYHAGNRKIAEPPPPAPPRKKPTEAGQLEYRLRKERKALVGKAVRLTRKVTLKSGKTYPKGSLWGVVDNRGQHFDIVALSDDGNRLKTSEEGQPNIWIYKVMMSDLEEDCAVEFKNKS